MSSCIKKNIHRLPEFDMVVGIPRSGMIPAYMIGMFLNKKVCSIDELVNGILPSSGYSREISESNNKKIIIVDDSIHSGVALEKTKEKLSSSEMFDKYEVKFLAIYAREQSKSLVDYYFEIVPTPRVFQWNYLNVKSSEKFCFDMDGVLCVDPTPEENDDGEKYSNFLLNAKPLYIPKSRIYAIVTSRLEKYRKETEDWLDKNGVRYDNLFMLDLPTKEDRIRLKCHASFKAKVFFETNAALFVESSDKQAKEIAYLSKKPCICVETDEMYYGTESDEFERVNEMVIEAPVDYQSIRERKILLFSHEFTYTGAPHSLLRISKILKNNGYYVEVWGPRYGPFVDEFKKIDIKVRIVPYDQLYDSCYTEIIRYFNVCIANTIITHKYYTFAGTFCPTIWYIREATNIPSMCKNVPDRENALRKSDNLYCVSEYAQEFIMKNYNRNVKVIHNCVEDESNNPNCFIKSDKQIINFLQMGSITERKAFDIYVNAYLMMPEEYQKKSHLYLVGQLIQSEKKFWEPLLKIIETNDNITYIGEIKNDDEKWAIMCNMDVIVVASRDESCSLVALEGTMLSKPIIVSENVGAKYAVNEKMGWIVETGSVESLSNAFKEAINRRDDLEKMGYESRKSYEYYSNMKLYEKKIINMIDTNIVDLKKYRLSKRKTIKELNIIQKGIICLKNEGAIALIRKMVIYYRGAKKIKDISILGTSGSKYAVDKIEGVRLKNMIKKCSILSEEFPRTFKNVDINISGDIGRNISIDIEKTMIDCFRDSKTGYLIIDLLDERFNLCRIKYANNADIVVTKTDALMNNLSNITIDGTVVLDEFITIVNFDEIDYQRKIAAFCKKIRGVFSRKKIVINECYLATKYLNNNGDVVNFDEKRMKDITRINEKLNKMYIAIIENIPDCSVIKMPEWATADENHKLGLNPMQYCNRYYEYIADQLREMICNPKFA